MAAPNIVNVSSIYGKTMGAALGTTAGADILSGASDKLLKINSIIVANVDGTNAADITVEVSVDNGSNYLHIAKTVSVPADATLVVVDKNSQVYLDETDLLRLTASANSDLEYVISGEILDDA